MTEQLVSYYTARLARDVGFDDKCQYGYYDLEQDNKGKYRSGEFRDFNDSYTHSHWSNNSNLTTSITAPPQCVLIRWIRENHNLLVYADWFDNRFVGRIKIMNTNSRIKGYSTIRYDTYNEALESAIQSALNTINKQNNRIQKRN